MYSRNPLFSITPVVKWLLIINVALLALSSFTPILYDYLSLYYPSSPYFYAFQYVTHMFMHADIRHLFSNMFAVWMFGSILENRWGSKRFLTYYLLTGIGAALIYSLFKWIDIHQLQASINTYLQNPGYDQFVMMSNKYKNIYDSDAIYDLLGSWGENQQSTQYLQQSKTIVEHSIYGLINSPMLGASGAVFGLLFAMAYLHGNTMLIFPFPMKIKYFVAIYALIEMYSVIQNKPEDNVAHIAHLAGMLVGFIIIKYWNKTSKSFY